MVYSNTLGNVIVVPRIPYKQANLSPILLNLIIHP